MSDDISQCDDQDIRMVSMVPFVDMSPFDNSCHTVFDDGYEEFYTYSYALSHHRQSVIATGYWYGQMNSCDDSSEERHVLFGSVP